MADWVHESTTRLRKLTPIGVRVRMPVFCRLQYGDGFIRFNPLFVQMSPEFLPLIKKSLRRASTMLQQTSFGSLRGR